MAQKVEPESPALRTAVSHGRSPRELAPTIAAPSPANPSPPATSDHLAQLAAHLPRISRDTYVVGREVAKGGIGRVVRARDQRLDRTVALKELLVWNEGQEQRFIHEALLTAKLQHPAIVPIYEAGRWPDGEPFYAMKLVSGRSLADLITERRKLEDRLSLLPHVLTVAQAIAYAHSQRILHRDLKPANVLVGEFGETVVIDWGLAKGLSEKEEQRDTSAPAVPVEGLTMEGAVVGTPAYMPPEQAAGKPVDQHADIYAIGAMLYHLIAAVPPYHDVPWEKLLAAIAEGPPVPLDRQVRTISDELCAIVNKAMARDPAKRYASAKELADDLERFQTGQIVAAHTYSARHLLRRFWRRNRSILSTAVAAAVLLTVVIVYAFFRTDSERRYALSKKGEAEIAEQKAIAARKAAVDAGRQATARADELTLLQAQGALARDPNQSLAWLKTLSPEFTGTDDVRRIATEAQALGVSRSFRGHTGHINELMSFGDGERFVTASDDRTLRIWNAATGESLVLAGHTDEAWNMDISPDRSRIASVSKDSTARLWDAATGRELGKVELPAVARQVRFRKDGTLIGCSGVDPGLPWIWKAPGSEVRFLADASPPIVASMISPDGEKVVLERKDGTVLFGDASAEDGQGTSGPRLRTLGKVEGAPHEWRLSTDGSIAMRRGEAPNNRTEYILWTTATGARKSFVMPGVQDHAVLGAKGDVVVLSGIDHIHVYDVATGTLTRRFDGHGSHVYWSALSADEQTLATGGFDRTLRTWSFATGETRSFAGLKGVVSAIAFWPDRARVLAGSSAGDVRSFEPPRAGTVLWDHKAVSTGLAVSADGRVASADEGGHLVITDLEGHRIAEHALGPMPRPYLLASATRRRFAAMQRLDSAQWALWRGEGPGPKPDRATIALGTFDAAEPTVVSFRSAPISMTAAAAGESLFVGLLDGSLFEVDAAGKATELDRSKSPSLKLAVSPDGAWLAEGCDDGTVRLLELSTRKVRELGRHKDAVMALDFATAGGLLASGSSDHTVRLWDLGDGSFRSLDASGSGVRQVGFSRDGKTLFVLNLSDAVLHRWAVDTGEPLDSFAGHRGSTFRFSLSADGKRLLTNSDDRTARVFDTATGKSRALTGHEKEVANALFAPGDRMIVTIGREGTVRAWPDDLPDTLPELRAWLDAATPDRIEGK